MHILRSLDAVMFNQRGHLFPWAPVCLAIGIGGYFGLGVEPGLSSYLALATLGIVCAAAAQRWPGGWSALGWAVTLTAAGFCLAGARAHRVAAPVLDWRYYGPVEGRIVALDRSASGAVRLTLDQVTLDDVAVAKRPARVRISLHTDIYPTLLPGTRIMTTAHLSPPQGPVEPGGFDFRRHAWFRELGAVGYARVPVLQVRPAESNSWSLRVLAIRLKLSEQVRAVLPGDIGGFAAAVTTGDRSGVSQSAIQALRASNLAHLLAISGLHMGLLAGFVFGAIRLALALIPPLGLRVPSRQIAAVGALIAAAAYLILSGGNVATERAFIMVAVVLCAVLVDRRAFSLRAVAVAALIVLALRPEALLGPGFQMSFAATTALVAVFGWLRDLNLKPAPGWVRAILGVVISSAVAGLATGPVGAAHFNTMSHFGLPANLFSVPLMGAVVIPGAVLAVVLSPLGLGFVGLWLMGVALSWILAVAHWVAGLDGAVGHVISPGPAVLPILALGLLWVMLWQGRFRWIGILPALVAFFLWAKADRPDILVADTGGLVGIMTDQGRALSKPKGAGFVAEIWLENDGDGAIQSMAADRWPGGPSRLRQFKLGKTEVIHIIGKRAASKWDQCLQDQLIIASIPLDLPGACTIYDPAKLRRTGSLALSEGKIVTARQLSGQRLWNTDRRRAARGQ